jgi:hypothetical protein
MAHAIARNLWVALVIGGDELARRSAISLVSCLVGPGHDRRPTLALGSGSSGSATELSVSRRIQDDFATAMDPVISDAPSLARAVTFPDASDGCVVGFSAASTSSGTMISSTPIIVAVRGPRTRRHADDDGFISPSAVRCPLLPHPGLRVSAMWPMLASARRTPAWLSPGQPPSRTSRTWSGRRCPTRSSPPTRNCQEGLTVLKVQSYNEVQFCCDSKRGGHEPC